LCRTNLTPNNALRNQTAVKHFEERQRWWCNLEWTDEKSLREKCVFICVFWDGDKWHAKHKSECL